ncbi:MAG: hypothetical protein IPP15_07225 [Saprospiraceae bacterium]|uniref:VWA domain-containing protein n=1 Tax=Candidatus Opimibacter skivensis TaxID=2982028 RepID=A0A9D7SWJ6_9BACT|nr:hypothetical protein [Candidatus Opimibacter skivensis]
MQNLSWQYPSWYLILCLLLGVGASVFLYYKDKTFSDQPVWLRYLMAILRGLVVTVLSSLLLAPLLKLLQNRTEPPVIILAQDQSASIRAALSKTDSVTYMKSLDDLYNNLSKKYEVHRIGFGQEVKELAANASWTLNDQASDLGEFMTYVDEQYRGQNVGAVIVASDGAINRGKSPLYIPLIQKAPLYAVALGIQFGKRICKSKMSTITVSFTWAINFHFRLIFLQCV